MKKIKIKKDKIKKEMKIDIHNYNKRLVTQSSKLKTESAPFPS